MKRGFTLVEMIGVLGVIAILASLLLPRIMTAVQKQRQHAITNAPVSSNIVAAPIKEQ